MKNVDNFLSDIKGEIAVHFIKEEFKRIHGKLIGLEDEIREGRFNPNFEEVISNGSRLDPVWMTISTIFLVEYSFTITRLDDSIILLRDEIESVMKCSREKSWFIDWTKIAWVAGLFHSFLDTDKELVAAYWKVRETNFSFGCINVYGY
jgi:hypothetical protein